MCGAPYISFWQDHKTITSDQTETIRNEVPSFHMSDCSGGAEWKVLHPTQYLMHNCGQRLWRWQVYVTLSWHFFICTSSGNMVHSCSASYSIPFRKLKCALYVGFGVIEVKRGDQWHRQTGNDHNKMQRKWENECQIGLCSLDHCWSQCSVRRFHLSSFALSALIYILFN